LFVVLSFVLSPFAPLMLRYLRGANGDT
jgi:hypothetical protein